MAEVVERVSELERMMKDLVYIQRQTEMKLASFIDEMKEFKDFTEKNITSLNKKWGDLANRLGTIAEDLVLPCFQETVEKYLGIKDPETIHSNTIVRRNGKVKEFDIIIIYSDAVILNEVKATATEKSIETFVNFVQEGIFFEYFPFLKGKSFLPFLSAMKFTEEALDILTQNGIYAVTPYPNMKILNISELQ